MKWRIVWSFLIALSIPLLFWLGGFDFDERGVEAVFCSIFTFCAFVLAAGYPGDYPGETK